MYIIYITRFLRKIRAKESQNIIWINIEREKKSYIYQSRGLYLAAIRNDSKVHCDNDNFVIVKLLPRDARKKEKRNRIIATNIFRSRKRVHIAALVQLQEVIISSARVSHANPTELIAPRTPFVFPRGENGRMINSAVVIWSVTVHENGWRYFMTLTENTYEFAGWRFRRSWPAS